MVPQLSRNCARADNGGDLTNNLSELCNWIMETVFHADSSTSEYGNRCLRRPYIVYMYMYVVDDESQVHVPRLFNSQVGHAK